jgi:hypothetical protein
MAMTMMPPAMTMVPVTMPVTMVPMTMAPMIIISFLSDVGLFHFQRMNPAQERCSFCAGNGRNTASDCHRARERDKRQKLPHDVFSLLVALLAAAPDRAAATPALI